MLFLACLFLAGGGAVSWFQCAVLDLLLGSSLDGGCVVRFQDDHQQVAVASHLDTWQLNIDIPEHS
jgi:hypothetical protein